MSLPISKPFSLVAPTFYRETQKLVNIRVMTFAIRCGADTVVEATYDPTTIYASMVRKFKFNAYLTNDAIFQQIA